MGSPLSQGGFRKFLLGDVVWTKRVIIIFILLNVYQLITSVINLENIVWLINYHSGYLIAEGIPMYEQSGYVSFPNGTGHSLPPDHFPLYFYYLAGIIKVFGDSQIAARVMTWVFLPLTALLLVRIVNAKTEWQTILALGLYYLDPLLFTTNFYGKHDQITGFLLIWGLFLFMQDRQIASGIVLSLGVMTKFFPIFAGIAIGIYYLKKREWRSLAKFSLSCILTTGLIFGYHLWRWGDDFLAVILFQVDRVTPSLSLWYYVIPESVEGRQLLPVQVFILVVVFVLIYLTSIENDKLLVFSASAAIVAIYLVINRQYYSTYAYFISLPLVPVAVDLFRRGHYTLFWLGISYMALFHVGNLFCYNSCYPQFRPFTDLSMLGIVVILLATLGYIPFHFQLLKVYRH